MEEDFAELLAEYGDEDIGELEDPGEEDAPTKGQLEVCVCVGWFVCVLSYRCVDWWWKGSHSLSAPNPIFTHTQTIYQQEDQPEAQQYLNHILDDFLSKARIQSDSDDASSDSGSGSGSDGSGSEGLGSGRGQRGGMGLFGAGPLRPPPPLPVEGDGGEEEEEEEEVVAEAGGEAGADRVGAMDDEVEEFLTRHEYLGVRACVRSSRCVHRISQVVGYICIYIYIYNPTPPFDSSFIPLYP